MSDYNVEISEINKNIGEMCGVLLDVSNSCCNFREDFNNFRKDYSDLMNVLRNIESLLKKIEKKIK